MTDTPEKWTPEQEAALIKLDADLVAYAGNVAEIMKDHTKSSLTAYNEIVAATSDVVQKIKENKLALEGAGPFDVLPLQTRINFFGHDVALALSRRAERRSGMASSFVVWKFHEPLVEALNVA